MGIPRLFYWLYTNYPDCLRTLAACDNLTDLEIDGFAIDFNAVIHTTVNRLYRKPTSLLHPSTDPPPTRELLFSEAGKDLEKLVNLVRPRKEVILFADGFPGLAKAHEQRKRRFRAAEDEESFKIFDRNQISPGTEFMRALMTYIKEFLILKVKTDWKYLSVIFSDDLRPGEGEAKIARYISRNVKNWKYCVISPDADVIMYCLGLRKNIYLLRNNIYDFVKCDYFVVDISLFKTQLTENILSWGGGTGLSRPTHPLIPNQQRYVEDFIYICFFIGNDFLPGQPNIEIATGGIETLLGVYSQIVKKYGHIVEEEPPRGRKVNPATLLEFLKELSRFDESAMLRKYNSRHGDTCKLLSEYIDLSGNLDFKGYREAYNREKIGSCGTSGVETDGTPSTHSATISQVCSDYFRGTIFVLNYYLHEMPDWEYAYPYAYSPFSSSLLEYLTSGGTIKFSFEYHAPFPAYQQLLLVLPPKCSYLLPEPARKLMAPESPLKEMYYTPIQIDLDGKIQEYEGIVILPHVDIGLLKKEYQKIEKKLPKLSMTDCIRIRHR